MTPEFVFAAPDNLTKIQEDHDEEPYLGHLAEGYTSPNESSGIDAAPRMFTTVNSKAICEKAPRPARLIALHLPITLYVAKWFPFDDLAILALDSSGNLLPHVPIAISVEHKFPPLLELSNDMVAEGKVLPLRAGRFLFHVNTACDDPTVEIDIPAEVKKP